jgi:hypothetical protein
MKKILVLISLFLLTCVNIIKAQNMGWAPIGAEWYYDYTDWQVDGYSRYSVEKDTLIDGINCKKISVYNEWYSYVSGTTGSHSGQSMYGGPIITYEEDSVIFILHNDTFDTLVDFTAKPGDFWMTPGQSCENYKTVLDTGSYDMNGCSGRWISYEYMLGFQMFVDTFYQNYGSIKRGFEISDSYCQQVAGLIIPTNLRCYSDSECTIKFAEVECDFLPTSVVHSTLGLALRIYPNPAGSFIRIENADRASLTLYDFTGKIVLTGILSDKNHKINVEYLSRGIYFIELNNLNTHKKHIEKIILN